MFLYILKRAFRSFLTLFFIITIVFSLLRLMPIEGYFSNYEKMSETQIKVELSRQNLDKPLPIQLWMFYKNIIKGDFGLSMKYRVNYPVTKIIAEKAPLSIRMGLLAMLVSLLVGIPLGILMAHSAKSRIGVWDMQQRTEPFSAIDHHEEMVDSGWNRLHQHDKHDSQLIRDSD